MNYLLDNLDLSYKLGVMASTNPQNIPFHLVSANRPILSSESGYGRTFKLASLYSVFPSNTAIIGRGLSSKE
jgi:hypothetical protein